MGDAPGIPADWTEPERWVWERIAAGEPADLNARDRRDDPGFENLDPRKEEGWTEKRRLRVTFLQAILTQKAFADATPHGGVRILGALVDDAPLNLEHARLQRLFWLERSRILVDLKGRNLRIDGELSLQGSFVASGIELSGADIRESLYISSGKFHGPVNLGGASIGSVLDMSGSTFEGRVSLNGATVNGLAFLSDDATFKDEVDLVGASIGSNLEMSGSTFMMRVSLSGATVKGAAFLSGGATFNDEVDLVGASIGRSLDFSAANIGGLVDLTACRVAGELRLGSSGHAPTRWEDGASLVLRNTHVGAVQDWWRNESDNSWPKTLQLEGFTYDRLGGLFGEGEEANMLARPVASYIDWLAKDPSFSPQPYEQLARFFRQAGEPRKADDILYEARERRRRRAWSKLDDHGHAKPRNLRQGLGLSLLRLTIGYGLGYRYFRALWWVGGLTLLGTLFLIAADLHSPASWLSLLFASLDQLLPIVTLNKAHDALIFGPPVAAQPYWIPFYFYVHKLAGWVLGSFIVAGLAGLTQRN